MTLDEFIDNNPALLKDSLTNQTLAVAWFWSKHEKKKTFMFTEMTETLKKLRLDYTHLYVAWRDLDAKKQIHMEVLNVYYLDRAVEKELDKVYDVSAAIVAGTTDELLTQADDHLAAGHLVQATTLAGGALETHLQNVIITSGVTLPSPGSIGAYKDLIARARKTGSLTAFSDSDLSHINGWGQDRNDAAHQPTGFKKGREDVRLMIAGIRNLISRTK